VDDPGNVDQLSAAAVAQGVTLPVLVEVNVGADRCGVAPGGPALALARRIAGAPGLRFAGLQAYQGSAQHLRRYEERAAAIARAVDGIRLTLDLLERDGLACERVSGAGTGTWPFEAASGVYTELQVGSYIFMDADYGRNLDAVGTQTMAFEQSLYVLATVMSRPVPERAVLDAGLKAVSVDSGLPLVDGHPGVEYVGVSDEHGTLALHGASLELGQKLRLVPGHCDPTVNLHDWFVCCRDGRVEALWPVSARGVGN
jgi:3-hydroxy-D-aspartate aldolase